MDLNKLSAKLAKAEILNQTDLISKYKKEIEELKQKCQQSKVSSNERARDSTLSGQRSNLTDELNKLNSKLTKAEILNQTDLVIKYKQEIENVKKKQNEESQAFRKQFDKSINYSDQLNKLGSKLAKAELLNQTNLVIKYKQEIERLRQDQKQQNENGADDNIVKKSINEPIMKESIKKSIKSSASSSLLNPSEYAAELNRLGSWMAKAEMRNQVDLIEEYQQQIDDLKRRHGQETEEQELKEETEEEESDNRFNRHRNKYNDTRKSYQDNGAYGPTQRPFSVRDAGKNPSKKVEREQLPQKGEEFQPNPKLILLAKRINESSMSLKQMFVKERGESADEEAKKFVASSSKFINVDDEYEGAGKRKKPRTQDEYVRTEVDDEDAPCPSCVTHIKPHLLLYYNDRLYVSVPDRTPLVDRQLLIRPVPHANNLVLAGEEVINDVNQARKVIGAMFDQMDQDVIFVEYYFKSQRWRRHFEIHCFPIPKKYAENLRMIFKKAIMECEHEWSINKKLVTVDRQVTRCLPKGLSYFWVQFGTNHDGYAHVIESDEEFSATFAEEIIAGTLNLDHRRWKKPCLENLDQQAKRIDALRPLWEEHSNF